MRLNKLIQHLEGEMEVCIKRWRTQLKQENRTNTKKILQKVQKRAFNTSLDSQVVITYLRSSAITENHQFKLAIYQEEPFLDAPIYETYLNMKHLYLNVSDDARMLLKELSPPYIQILSYEEEQIKRNFTARLYEQSYHFFEQILKEMATTNNQRPVYFGEEMSELRQIGVI